MFNKKLLNVSLLAKRLNSNRTSVTRDLDTIDLSPFIDEFILKASSHDAINNSVINITELSRHLGISQVACSKKARRVFRHKFTNSQVEKIIEILNKQLKNGN